MRVDLIHISDCFGLFLLTVVAVGQYYIRVAKHNTQPLQHHSGGNVQHHSVSTGGNVQHHSVSNHVGGSSMNSIQKSPSVNNLHMRHPQISAYTPMDSYDIEEERESLVEEHRSTMNHRDHSHRMNGLTTQPYQVIQSSTNTSKPPPNGQHQQHND